LDDLDPATPPTDVTSNFPGLLETGRAEGVISVGSGNNRLTIVADGGTVASGTMFNFSDDTLAIHPEIDSADVEKHGNAAVHRTTLLLIFEHDATEVAISELLRAEHLLPIGVLIDRTLPSNPKIVLADTTQNRRGRDAASLAFTLSSPRPAAPLTSALPNILMSAQAVSAEEITDRLLRGPPPDFRNGYGTNPNRPGGFDFSGLGVSELHLAWPHFLMETFAAHRLRSKVVPRNTRVPTLAVVDSGFGNGGLDSGENPVLDDIPLGRLGGIHPVTGREFHGIDLVRIFRAELGLRAVRSTIEDLADFHPLGHGTPVALFAAGGGGTILGTGRHVTVLPVRVQGVRRAGDLRATSSAVAFGLVATATITQPSTDVVNLSMGISDEVIRDFLAAIGIPPSVTPPLVTAYRMNYASLFRPALNLLRKNGIIVVNAAGNENSNTNLSVPAMLAPVRGQRGTPVLDGARNRLDYPLLMVVSGTGLARLVTGPEKTTDVSDFGLNVSVSAPAEGLIGRDPNGNVVSVAGTSFAAPFVSGLAAKLIQIDEALRNEPAAAMKQSRRLQIIEAIEASADDLGTTAIAAPRLNNDPGNGPDDRFGYGRVNAWKATLTVVNGGTPAEGGTDADGDGLDDRFKSLRFIAEPDTKWYGFKIRTPMLGATAWLDGVQLQDQGAPVPNTPLVTAYAGVHHNYVPAVPGAFLPIGTIEGEYLMTFSIERADLVDAQGQPRTLSLKGPGATAADAPFFNLRMELDKMRAGHVPGVRFHGFVFDISPTDFGDAPDAGPRGYATLLVRSNGARHLNSNLEWFGEQRPDVPRPVTPETNAAPEVGPTAPDSSVDPDGVPNFIGPNDLDRFDDGVTFYPLTYRAGQTGIVEFTVCSAADLFSNRYSADHCCPN
jgi:subtilisin family serine protease